jgi:hypothetical protein
MRKISTATIIALTATGIFLTLVTAGLIATQTIPSDGTVISPVNIGAYTDSQCTQNCTNISWGTLNPNTTTNKTIYVKNTGTVPLTLSMTTESRTPTDADDYLTLTWDQQSTILNPDETTPANLTLSVAADTGDLTSFSFNIVITGTE